MALEGSGLGQSNSSGGISRSSRLDSLSSIANTSPPLQQPHSPSLARTSLSTSPTSPWSDRLSLPNSATPSRNSSSSQSLAPPSSSSSSTRTPGKPASLKSASSSSSRTNTGFQVTSRTRNYIPPLSPSIADSLALPQTSSSSATASGSFFPPNPSFPFASTSDAVNQGYLGRRGSSPATFSHASSALGLGAGVGGPAKDNMVEPKTTLTLSSSIDSKGRRMVNQYVRLKTIGQGSHGKVWLCAEPTIRESSEDDDEIRSGEGEEERMEREEREEADRRRRRKGKHLRSASERWEEDIDEGRVQYCAIKSVAREGPGRHKSLRMAKNRKASTQGSGGIGADDKVKREVAIMKRLDHPNIVRLKEVIDDAKSKKVFMVLEFMAGGQVVWQDDNKQPTLTVDEARRTFRDVVLGLEYLHYQGIIHRDIKPANLLWTEDHNTVKISDFGVSHVSDALLRASPDDGTSSQGEDDKALRKTAGSPAFFAPELCHPAEYTPTPTAHPSQPHLNEEEDDAYFPRKINNSSLQPSSHNMVYTPPASPNGIPLTSKLISLPLPVQSPSQPRTRPPVGKGIDVWALGVTLYCLLFGDTPFTARTEYELYNVIVHESIRIPQRMGVEKAWTGVGSGWDGCGEGTEGREVIDLLGRLLEKDPTKRITLEQVKKHPWVLRNLSSPESWLDATDPAQTDHVVVTEEDLQHATQERGSVDTLPPIRNRPGIRRALNAALARFPAFSRIKSTRTTASTNSDEREQERRSRSKSNSSTGHSVEDAPPGSASVSRQSSDAAGGRKKDSLEFAGADFRRVISSSAAVGGGSRSASPAAPIGLRGGLGNRSIRRNGNDTNPHSPSVTQATAFPELARSISSSSAIPGQTPGGRSSHFARFFNGHRPFDESRTPSAPSSPSLRGGVSYSPNPNTMVDTTDSDLPATPNGTTQRHRTLTKMLSRLGAGGGGSTPRSRKNSPASFDRNFASSSTEAEPTTDFVPSQEVLEQFESREKYDAFGRLVRQSEDSSSVPNKVEPEEDEGGIDLTEFEYSDSDPDDDDDDAEEDDDSDLDELRTFGQPLASADHFSGWNVPAFADFSLGPRAGDDPNSLFSSPTTPPTATDSSPDVDPLDEKFKPSSTFAHYDQATPRAQGQGPPLIQTNLPPPPPAPVFSLSAASPVENRSSPFAAAAPPVQHHERPPYRRDGSMGGVTLEPPKHSRKWSGLSQTSGDADEEDGEEEILVVPRRRRAPTLQQQVSDETQHAPR